MAVTADVARREVEKFKETEEAISLHGLGFLQVKLGANQRLHVWHPDLPRRRCFRQSAIHDHRFAFTSRVLVGTQVNHLWKVDRPGGSHPTHILYLHEGPRSRFGNRPWKDDGTARVSHFMREVVEAGQEYKMWQYIYHSTEPGGDGRVATLMTKTWEGDLGAHSSCEIGVAPDVDFDRKQMAPDDMWRIVRDVMERA